MTDPLFLVEHFDLAGRRAWFSCDRQWTRRNVIEGIADGQIDCVVKVLEIHEAVELVHAGYVFDETRDIAEEVDGYLRQHNPEPSYEVLTFLQANGLRTHEMAE